MQPEIHIGPLTLQTFGICFGLAFVACGAILARRLRELGKPRDWAYEIVFSALVGGLVGARVDYIVQNYDKVSNDLLGNLFSGSGLVWLGGLVGGALGVVCGRGGAASWRSRCSTSARCRSRSATRSGGSAASSRATATTATASDLPWAMAYPKGTVPTTTEVHPTPVYETLAMGAVALVLWNLRDRVRPGMLFALYLVLAGRRAAAGRVHPPQRRGRARAHPAAADQRGDDRGGRGCGARARRRSPWPPRGPDGRPARIAAAAHSASATAAPAARSSS